VLSRAVEDSGTVTSVLVPWNTCGAYISGVLGVPTASYVPYCFFNLLSPVLDVLYGFIGFKVPSKPSTRHVPGIDELPEQAEVPVMLASGREAERPPG
jgi:Na+:H+ antiporter, NhaC family